MSDVTMSTINPSREADFHFQWSWGESGYCAADERGALEQTRENLGPSVSLTFAPLQKGPKPIELEERVNYEARIIAQSKEIESQKQISASLYEKNTTLQSELRHAVLQKANVSTELEALKETHATTLEQLAVAEKQMASDAEELRQLRAIVSAAPSA